jgi:hypothetical protein
MLATTLVMLLAAGEPTPPHIGVSDFTASKELQPVAGAMAGYVANELQRLGTFRVTTTDQTRQLLSLDRQAQLMGCPDDTCRGAAVMTLGFDYLVTSKFTKLAVMKGSTLTLELVLIDVKTGKREASDISSAGTEGEMMNKLTASVVKLLGSVLRQRSGSLVLQSAEKGASVKIDDSLVGTVPVGKVEVAGGPHIVKVEKEGFVTWQKEIRVKPEETVEESARLVPSPDYISAWRDKHNKLRIAAWASTGLFVASLSASVAMAVRAQSVYGTEDTKGTFLYERRFILNGIEEDGSGNHRIAANQLKTQVESARMLGFVGAGVAGASAVASAVLWLYAEDPGRYDAYKSTEVKGVHDQIEARA